MEDAIDNVNVIVSPQNFSNQFSSKIYVRHQYPGAAKCPAFSEVNLDVAIYKFDDSIRQNLYTCDDDEDGISNFDLREFDNTIKNLFPGDQPVTIKHYTSQQDAEQDTNAIPFKSYSNYRNISSPFEQMIYTRSQNMLAPDCSVYIQQVLTLIVNPIPETENITAEICNDPISYPNTPSIGLFDLTATNLIF